LFCLEHRCGQTLPVAAFSEKNPEDRLFAQKISLICVIDVKICFNSRKLAINEILFSNIPRGYFLHFPLKRPETCLLYQQESLTLNFAVGL
jgi:hypothetical protein